MSILLARAAAAAAIVGGVLLVPNASSAQGTFPDRPVKFVVPSPPGTTLDLLPRILGKKLTERWKQPVVVVNRPGAANVLGAEVVAHSEPDGLTLLATPPGPLVLSQWLESKLPYEPEALVPITVLVLVPQILVVNPKVPVNNFAEWIAYAKAHPSAMAYGSPGGGSAAHLAQDELTRALGVQLLHVPYQGMAPAINDLLANHIQTMFAAAGTVLPQIQEGKLRAIAIAGGDRLAQLPEVPVIKETLPTFNHMEWFAIVAPPRTPPAIVDELWRAISEAAHEPEVQKRLKGLALVPVVNSPSEAAAFIKAERERWRAIVAARRERGEPAKP